MAEPVEADVVVVGAGNAALCAALAAREAGADVLVLERAPRRERGGDTGFTAGAMRVTYETTDELIELFGDLSPGDIARSDFGTYGRVQFLDDLARVTEYRCDPDLAGVLVDESMAALCWMRTKGVRFMPIWGRQAFEVDGRFRFWGGLVAEVVGGGPGLVDALVTACERDGVRITYDTRATRLIADDDGVHGVVAVEEGVTRDVAARAVVLASGGFQANTEWRTKYLGPGWELAKVRGTRFNTGDGIRMALEVDAMPWGHWSGCHAVGWDRNAPPFGDLAVGDGFQKHSYPFGIMVNAAGERFVDEGADFRNYTYAKYGSVILRQPGQFAWQVFDAKVAHLLRDEYRIRQATKVQADAVEELVVKLEGVDTEACLKTIADYNASVDTATPFDPNVKDGRGTVGLELPKSNWANTLDTPPFVAYQVTCGLTFTFGGLRITPEAEVVNTAETPIPGLFAAGELVGGLFYFNYPGGTGLTAGSVFGLRAGRSAARSVARR
ncbi:MAG: FAD-dependent tricarballylate dehydrogenase TcuA [Acidimicrobiales bacterium]